MGVVYAKEMNAAAGGVKPAIPPAGAAAHRSDDTHIMVTDLGQVAAKVQNVHVEGLNRTKDDIVSKQIKDVFRADNFHDMVQKTQEAKIKLERLGVFKKVAIFIDTSQGTDASPEGYDVTFVVREGRRLTGGVSTMLGTNEGSLVRVRARLLFTVKHNNLLGRAECVNADYRYGTKDVGYGINFIKPINGNPDVMLILGAKQASGEFPWSGFKQTDRGFAANLMLPSRLGSHSLQWEGVWREVQCLPATTAFHVREQSGHSLKSSVIHSLSRDTRDSKVLPTEGYLMKITKEFAGLGGDTRYLKGDVELQYNLPLLLDTVAQVSFAGGLMRPMQGNDVHLADRLFLGGPLTLRGFNLKGVGPHQEGSALGANTYWCAAAHLYTPLPFRPGKGGFGELFRTHLFVNAGNLANINLDHLSKQNLTELAQTFRWSYGAGIVLRMGGVARMELNYCWPMRAQQGDSVNPGVQFGIGLSFL